MTHLSEAGDVLEVIWNGHGSLTADYESVSGAKQCMDNGIPYGYLCDERHRSKPRKKHLRGDSPWDQKNAR